MKPAANEKLRRLTLTGILTALTTVATMLIRIPTPTKGYINLGDTIVNLSAWILGPVYGAAAGGIGSALADLFAGYTVYCPATLIIKALMAVAAFYVYQMFSRKSNSIGARIASAVAAEIIMITGYAVFEGFLYGSAAMAVASVTGNLVQGIFGAGASVALYELLLRHIPTVRKDA
jgi:uncharacterized membrane protein